MWISISRRCLPWACSALLYGLTALPGMAEQSVIAADNADTLKVASVFGDPLPTSELAEARGGSFHTDNQMTLTGTTSQNSAQNVATGSNSIEAGAFDHMTGLPVVVQNSGANVLIQNAVIVNLQMQ